MSKAEETTTVTMADEANPQESVPLKDKFFRHYRSFLYCGITCIGGFQLGESCLLLPFSMHYDKTKGSILGPSQASRPCLVSS